MCDILMQFGGLLTLNMSGIVVLARKCSLD